MMINEDVFELYESQARTYCRSFPATFDVAQGCYLYDSDGVEYLDMLSGAGALNYGHNQAEIKNTVIEYMQKNGVLMSLDLHTEAKKHFIASFRKHILEPRNLTYKLQFTSPTGTSVVESAVKLARKVTGRNNVICFTNGFHGMSGTSLSLTGNRSKRQAVSQGGVTRLPYHGYLGQDYDSIAFYRKLFTDSSSGVDLPAAIILETIQGEGGVNVASVEWLQGIRRLADDFGIKLIIDDIQAGVGRTGKFFSFEHANIEPDLVCLSKSIGGIGFPMALLLIKPDMDIWAPGEDNGTFRGNNLAFVASTKMLELFWQDKTFEQELHDKEAIICNALDKVVISCGEYIKESRGRGFFQGLEFYDETIAVAVTQQCFENKIIIETCGERDQVLKFMPALNIPSELLRDSMERICNIIVSVCEDFRSCAIENSMISEGA
ncbi:diaminobutyrate--2-oxoglutarate transaminase [Pseudoalteromonas sp. HM-SA03]|uniref:diaminobutyrate--2-oxoglutarate transaminase n=1 Tax=Pseudoalteromonas sp. HM-SA03 TaxID=2029678 RepID=UPI000BAE4CBD|nr:diaminobutyrate--2-oxoglutarate transaminase [Pseudoalteromonas sp. HM-SA03]PAX99279.1 diaminobutyrate--2-oxoglutarate transaminase [Pseudoalteromonas sp. HM-SA03]